MLVVFLLKAVTCQPWWMCDSHSVEAWGLTLEVPPWGGLDFQVFACPSQVLEGKPFRSVGPHSPCRTSEQKVPLSEQTYGEKSGSSYWSARTSRLCCWGAIVVPKDLSDSLESDWFSCDLGSVGRGGITSRCTNPSGVWNPLIPSVLYSCFLRFVTPGSRLHSSVPTVSSSAFPTPRVS